MGDLAGSSGHFAWSFSATAAVATHILLLAAVEPAPVSETISAATAITWEVVSQVEPPPAPESVQAGPAATASTPLTAAKMHAARARVVPDRTSRSAAPQSASTAVSGGTASASAAASVASMQPAQATAAAQRLQPAADSGVNRSARAVAASMQREQPTRAADSGVLSAGREASAATSHSAAASGEVSGGGRSLLRAPRLIASRAPCAGYFPGAAEADRGQVQLSIDVDAEGHSHPSQTLSELPRGQGFENAAKACAAKLHFIPALDAHGQPVAAQARIALSFDRS